MKAASELEVPKKHVLKLRNQVKENFAAPEATKDTYVSKQTDTPKERSVSTQDRLKELRAKAAKSTNQKDQNQERLRRLRERKRDDSDKGPELER